MHIGTFHREWASFISGKSGMGLIDYISKDVLDVVLQKNPCYCRMKAGQPNTGIGAIVAEFRSYVLDNVAPSKERVIALGETAYPLWLLGIRLESKYGSVLHKRINEYFKGSSYYETSIPGFRQFEYEAQTICRLVEESIEFQDADLAGEPDLLVCPDDHPFHTEIKLPTSNVTTALSKSLSQIHKFGGKGAVVIGLDQVLSDLPVQDRPERIAEYVRETNSKISGTEIVVYLDYLPPGCTDGSEIRQVWDAYKADVEVARLVHLAMTGEKCRFVNASPG